MATRPNARSTRLLVVVFVSISLATITLDYKQGEHGPLAGLGRTALELMAPLQRAVTSVTRPVSHFFAGLAHLPSLQAENERLKEQVAALESQALVSAGQGAELARLRELLGLKQSFTFPTKAALVIANNPSNFEWTITINLGSADGVTSGDPVVVGAEGQSYGALVGNVARVGPHEAFVQEIIDPTANVASVVMGSDYRAQTGLVEGAGGDDMKMTLVDSGTPVKTGDTVQTAGYQVNGQQGLYPPGILIGEVSRTLPPGNEVDAFIRVQPAVDFTQLDTVLVLETRSVG